MSMGTSRRDGTLTVGERRVSWRRTNLEDGTVGGDRQGVECDIGRSAFESELGFEIASFVAGRGMQSRGEEEEEGGDGEGLHCRCLVDGWIGEMIFLLCGRFGC